MPLCDARRTLDALADRGILLDVDHDGVSEYVLPPPMAGFFEFSLMRVRDDLDQQLLSELFYQYLNVEEDFIRELFTRGQTQLGRVFVNERAVPPGLSLRVLDYERATDVVRTASHIGVGVCYCRHKMQHVGRACDAPMHNCLTFNTTASSLVRHGVARGIDAVEALDLISEARRPPARAVRRERAPACQLHLQLLRLLLRGDDRRPPVRAPAPGTHDELPAGDRRRRVQRLRQVRSRPALSKPSHSYRRTTPRNRGAGRRASTRARVSAAACACRRARAVRCP